jgi:oligosaccharide 4-alpha-D-glucosyltransferase
MKYKLLLLLSLCIFITIGFSQFTDSTKGNFQFSQYGSNIIKITYQPSGYTHNENVSDAVIGKPVATSISNKQYTLQGKGTIALKNFQMSFIDGKISIKNSVFELNSVFEKAAFRGFTFKLQPGEKIFGGGERALPLNRRGYKFNLYNNPWYGYSDGADNLNYSVPFFTSSNGYGLFFDNAAKGYADIGKTDSTVMEAGFLSGQLNVYIIFGADYQEILTSYFKLTGTQPLPPRWALGNFMSRFGYSSETQVKQILATMQQQQFPVDAIIFDLFWFGDSIKGTLGNLDWVNKSSWPNPKEMIGSFNKQQIKSILIAEPFILKGTRTYTKAQPYLATDSAGKPFELTDFYFGKGGLLDIFKKDAGDWIWKDHYKKQIANGITGWWTDLGEPEKHPAAIMHNLSSFGFKRLFAADEVHNVYGHYWNRMLFNNYAKDYPNKRLFHLNRSGFAGSQRYSIFPWSGDVSRNWSGFKAQLPLMLGMSMSGVPYIHADAGGFAGGEGDNELYTRWLQFAAFTPIFRPHGTALFELDKNAFSFPSEPALIAKPYSNYANEIIRLRYSLLPYNYTLAYQQAANGKPLVAPLYYYYPKDTMAIKIQDEFMWGENILVAPVTEKGLRERAVYLPKGFWYPFPLNNYEAIKGETYTKTLAAINQIPLFVKAGSFIVTYNNSTATNTTALKNDTLSVDYYSSNQPSSYQLYEDDGADKLAIKNKQFQLISFTANPKGTKTTFTIQTNGGNFAGRVKSRKINFTIHGPISNKASIYVNNQIVKCNAVNMANSCSFPIIFKNQPILIEIK